MAGIFGLLGIPDSSLTYVQAIGQQVMMDAVNTYLAQAQADWTQAANVFVQATTENHTERYMLPGGGRLQERGRLSNTAAVKASGSWDVAYELRDFGATVGWDDVSYGYLTVQDVSNALQTILIQDTNTRRFHMLKALFNNTARTFSDEVRGSLTIQPLANGDSVVYPPVLGSETEATETHYVGSNYLNAAISDTNNPLPTIRDELEEHFGAATGGENIVVFCNQATTPYLSALTDFYEVEDRWVRMGDNISVPVNLPNVPGRIMGRAHGVWVVEYRWIPADFLLGIHLDAPAPLKMRVDPSYTNLGQGLQLKARNTEYPLMWSEWRDRFGFGVANRLNGYVMKLVGSTSYAIPTAYA